MKTPSLNESQPDKPNAAALASAASPGASADEWPLVIEGGDSIQPSTSADSLGHLTIPFAVPAGPVDPATQHARPRQAMIALSLGVEDWGEAWISRSGSEEKLAHIDLLCSVDNPAGKLGGHAYQTGASNVELETGEYALHVVQSNIDMENPAYNISIWNYKLEGELVEEGGKKKPDCPCCAENGDDGGAEPLPSPQSLSLGKAATGGSSAPGSGVSWRERSCGGRNARALSTESGMFWQVGFGSFRGMGGIPQGTLELMAEASLEGYESPEKLQYNHPLASRIALPEGGMTIGARCSVVCGVESMDVTYGGGEILEPVGVFTGSGNKMEYGQDESNPFVRSGTDGSRTVYDREGRFASYTSPLGSTVTADEVEDYLVIVRGKAGEIRQIWNYWDGLVCVEDAGSRGYDISFYTPAQVTVHGKGSYTAEGEPFKKFSIRKTFAEDELFITETSPGRDAYQTRWNIGPGGTLMVQGTGEDAVRTRRTSVDAGNGVVWQTLEVMKGESGVRPVDQHILDVYHASSLGPLLVSRREGSPLTETRTTTYGYDAKGRKTSEKRPDGSVWEWAYDAYGRETLRREPWAGGKARETRTSYRPGIAEDIAEQTVLLYPSQGAPVELMKSVYAYPEMEHVKRVEKRMRALGSEEEQLDITETWLGTAPNPYAKGRVRMERGIDGIETHYIYAASSEHGALYSVTAETRVDGEPVAGQSIRQIRFVSVEGNTVREESMALTSEGTWELTDAADYAFDVQNRWSKRTRANGRVTERETACDGRVLWERDENNILTSNAYNSARQLVETIRSAVMDGETCVTPETIVSYTRDALGRATTTRTDTGALTTLTSAGYDDLGRLCTEADAQGRVTVRHFSQKGLTGTVILPGGATLIEERHADGSLLRRSGTGQQDTAYTTDLAVDGIRTTVTVAGGHVPGDETAGNGGAQEEQATEPPRVITGRTIVDGFGQTLRIVTPHTMDDGNYRHLTWDGRGRLIREQWESMAPTLWEYDAFGNRTKESVVLDETVEPAPENARIKQYATMIEQRADGIYRVTQTTVYTAEGHPVTTREAVLLSRLSATIESKTVRTDARGQETAAWTEYGEGAERIEKHLVPGIATTSLAHVVDGFTVRTTDPSGIVTARQTRTYTATGMTLVQTDARGNATTTVTGKTGLPLTVTDAAGHTTSYAYAYPHDKPATVTDALGHTAHYAYDARGRKTAEWGTGIQPAVYAYNDADRLVSLTTWRAPSETVATDPRERTDGDTTTWSYDRATGLPVRKTYADGTCEITSYDTLNRVSAITNARGQISTRGYGPKTGELTGVTFANADGSEASPAQSYVYNHLGQLVSVTDGSGTRRIAYNAFNEAVEETREGAWNATLAETHDACGRPAGYILQYNGSPVQTTAWSYDQAGRLQTVTLNELAKPFQYGYDQENGLLISVSYPNPLTRQTSYEATRDLVAELTYKRPGSTNDPAKVAYAYDELGRPTERKDYFNTPEPGLTHAYAYNERGEITGESLSTGGNNIYTYDNIGNRTTSQEGAATHPTTYAANVLNQYTGIQEGEPGDGAAAPPFVPTYDADGNQTLVKTSTGIWQVSYNAENRPVRFENADSPIIVTCSYDSMGRRYEKKVEKNGIATSRKLYLYRGYLQIAELDATNANESTLPVLRKTYLWDPSEPVATRVLAMTCFDEAGNYVEDLYYTHDALKNTTALFGILGGRRASYTYGAYGQTLSMDGNACADNPFRYSSEYYDEELGMISYNFRHYNPQDGRWINREPIYETGSYNLYSFLHQQPNQRMDLLGLVNICYIAYDKDGWNGNAIIGTGVAALEWGLSSIIKITYSPDDFNPNELCPKEKCINSLKIMVHGSYKEDGRAIIYWGTNEGGQLQEAPSVSQITNMLREKNINFCANATLEFITCNIGKSKPLRENLDKLYKDKNVNIILHNYPVFPDGTINPFAWGLEKLVDCVNYILE